MLADHWRSLDVAVAGQGADVQAVRLQRGCRSGRARCSRLIMCSAASRPA